MARPSRPDAFPRPRVVLSRCLEVEACRYNGQLIRSSVVRLLQPFVDFVPVCPEVEIGLGVPRDPIRLVRIDGATHLVQPSSGEDLTSSMKGFAGDFLGSLRDVDGFILKSRSPSCGIDRVKVYSSSEDGAPVDHGPGMFAEAVLSRLPDTPVEHEGRLTNAALRDHFFTRLFAHAGLRELGEEGGMAELVAFHARQKLTLMAHSPSLQRTLGRIVANPERRPFTAVHADYVEGFGRALRRRPSRGTHINVLQHAQGYFKEELSSREKAHFLDLLEDYRERRIGRGPLLAVLQSWVHRFGEDYLASQSLLAPYPRALLDPADSGNARAV